MNRLKRKWFVIPIFIIGIALVLLGLLSDNKGNNNSNNGNNNVVDNNDNKPMDDGYTGIYGNDSTKIYIYKKNDTIYYAKAKWLYGKATLENNKAKEAKNVNGEKYDYSFEFADNKIIVDSNDSNLPKGTYEKLENITLEQFFEESFAEMKYFNSSYNGLYSNGDMKMILYQIDDKKVKVIIEGEDGEVCSNFNIQDSKISLTMTSKKTYSIDTSNSNELVMTTICDDCNNKVFDGKYKKIRNITINDILNSELIFEF